METANCYGEINNDSFSVFININLPLENSFKKFLINFVENVDELSLERIPLVRKDIQKFEEILFDRCREFSAAFLNKVVLPNKAGLKGVRFVYRIDLMKCWRGEFFVANRDGYTGRVTDLPGYGPTIIEGFSNEIGSDDMLLREYVLATVLLDFDEFYGAHGRVYPARIELISNG